jgi:phytoene dehydrogenase-like protein
VRLARGRLLVATNSGCSRRHGPGAFKVDWALDGPIPWRAEECHRAGTVHLGGTLDEISRSEWDAWSGRVAERPFVLVVQPTLADPTRAPAGKHVAWAYCHGPNGSDVDMTDRIEAQVERFAPGSAVVLARSRRAERARGAQPEPRRRRHQRRAMTSAGVPPFRGAARPVSTPPRGRHLLCVDALRAAESTACGYHAARAALRNRNDLGRRVYGTRPGTVPGRGR